MIFPHGVRIDKVKKRCSNCGKDFETWSYSPLGEQCDADRDSEVLRRSQKHSLCSDQLSRPWKHPRGEDR